MIYFLDEDRSVRDFVLYTLQREGMEAEGFSCPSALWAALALRLPELLLLELDLPEEDGMDVLHRIRSAPDTRRLPVIVLSARSTEFDRVLALDEGADDFVSKPFSMLELLSRIRAVLRRTGSPCGILSLGPLSVSPEQHEVRISGESVSLTLKEFELLRTLLENRGRVLTRTQLQDRVWGYEFDGESRTVDVHIRTLRQKLGPCGAMISTVRGVGYKIAE